MPIENTEAMNALITPASGNAPPYKSRHSGEVIDDAVDTILAQSGGGTDSLVASIIVLADNDSMPVRFDKYDSGLVNFYSVDFESAGEVPRPFSVWGHSWTVPEGFEPSNPYPMVPATLSANGILHQGILVFVSGLITADDATLRVYTTSAGNMVNYVSFSGSYQVRETIAPMKDIVVQHSVAADSARVDEWRRATFGYEQYEAIAKSLKDDPLDNTLSTMPSEALHVNFNSMTRAQMEAYAEEHGIDISAAANNRERREILQEHEVRT